MPVIHLAFGVADLFALARLMLALAAFWFPGFWWVSWLHRPSAYHWTLRAALGWAWSLAVFALVAWPFLWFQWRFEQFLLAVAGVWLAWVISLFLLRRVRSMLGNSPPPESMAFPIISRNVPWPTVGLLLGYMFLCGLVVWIPHADWFSGGPGENTKWVLYGVLLTLLLGTGILLAWICRGRLDPWLRFEQFDDLPAPRLVRGIAIGFIVLQAFSAAYFDRPDWDDCYYLAAVLEYQHSDVLNAEEPTHREGLPVDPINVLLAWELWQAVLCRLSGLSPLTLAHTLLPALLVLLAYAGYWNLLAETVPRRWVPLAMLGVAAYHVWGASSHDTPANFLLTRLWQGKAVLIHLAVPLIVLMLREISRCPTDLRRWLSLLACVLFGLAASPVGVGLEIILLLCLGASFVATFRKPRRWLILLTALLALTPALAMGWVIKDTTQGDSFLQAVHYPHWDWQAWGVFLWNYLGHGSAEIMWLLFLPVLALLLNERDKLAYLVIFPLVLFGTIANPLAAHLLGTHLSPYLAYFRIFWLFPIAAGLGAVEALLARLLASLTGPAGARGQGIPLLIVLLGLALTWCLPTIYVWSGRNLRMVQPDAQSHQAARNLLKLPPDLITIADRLLEDRDLGKVRVLAPERIASYLTPYSRDFRLVQPRAEYTMPTFQRVGRGEEGERRFLLTLFLTGEGAATERDLVRHPLPRAPLAVEQVRQWLDEFRVKYLIVPARMEHETMARIREVGFTPAWIGAEFTLWQRMVEPGAE